MPPVLAPVTYEPIKAVRVLSAQGNAPQLFRSPEINSVTFNLGVPVMLSGGFVTEWTTGASNTVYGVSSERAHNYTTSGVATDLNETASAPPPNQPSAIVIPMGAAIRDGNCGVYGANGQTVFSIALKAGQVFTNALLGSANPYQLIKDGTSTFWYLDNTLTGGNAGVAVLIGLDSTCPNTAAGGTRVFFQFVSSRRFFS